MRSRAGWRGASRPSTPEVDSTGCGNDACAAGAVWACDAARIGRPDYCFSFAVKLAMACIDPATLRRRRVSEAKATAQTSREDELGKIVQTATPVVEELPTQELRGPDLSSWELSCEEPGWQAVPIHLATTRARLARHTGELKALRNCGAISVEDFKRLLEGYDQIKFQLEGMMKKGPISEGDFETLSADLRRLESAREFVPARNCGATSAEDFTPSK